MATRVRRGNASGTIIGSALDLVFSTAIGGFSLTSFLSALERQDLSDIQAEPVITTLDNRKADILVGEETPARVVDAGNGGGGATATVQFKETGIRLTVTPHVTSNRQVSMELHTERSALQPLAASDLGFIFQTQRADNQLLVNDGETAASEASPSPRSPTPGRASHCSLGCRSSASCSASAETKRTGGI